VTSKPVRDFDYHPVYAVDLFADVLVRADAVSCGAG
jgi:hypothetical protein